MSVETKETIREKIAQSRRLLLQMTDPITTENQKAHIEELERQLLLEMGSGPPEQRLSTRRR